MDDYGIFPLLFMVNNQLFMDKLMVSEKCGSCIDSHHQPLLLLLIIPTTYHWPSINHYKPLLPHPFAHHVPILWSWHSAVCASSANLRPSWAGFLGGTMDMDLPASGNRRIRNKPRNRDLLIWGKRTGVSPSKQVEKLSQLYSA